MSHLSRYTCEEAFRRLDDYLDRELSPEETAVKRRLVALCTNVYGLFDSSKVGRFALHPFAESSVVTGLITDAGTPDEEVMAWKAVGVPVQRVPVEPAT